MDTGGSTVALPGPRPGELIIKFPLVPNAKSIIFRCPKIWAHYSLIMMCLNIRTPINHHYPFGKIVGLGVPTLKHFRVYNKIPQAAAMQAGLSSELT